MTTSSEGIETRISMSPEILSFLQGLYKDQYIDRSIRSKIRIALTPPTSNTDGKIESISYDVLEEIHHFYMNFKAPKDESKLVELRDLVKSSKVYNYNIPEPKRCPELVQRLEKLQREVDQKEYNAMVKNVKKKKITLGQEIGGEIRSTKQQFSSIINFLLSVGATFAFGYVASQYAFSDNLGFRILLSIFLASLVAVAELFFMSRHEI